MKDQNVNKLKEIEDKFGKEFKDNILNITKNITDDSLLSNVLDEFIKEAECPEKINDTLLLKEYFEKLNNTTDKEEIKHILYSILDTLSENTIYLYKEELLKYEDILKEMKLENNLKMI